MGIHGGRGDAVRYEGGDALRAGGRGGGVGEGGGGHDIFAGLEGPDGVY